MGRQRPEQPRDHRATTTPGESGGSTRHAATSSTDTPASASAPARSAHRPDLPPVGSTAASARQASPDRAAARRERPERPGDLRTTDHFVDFDAAVRGSGGATAGPAGADPIAHEARPAIFSPPGLPACATPAATEARRQRAELARRRSKYESDDEASIEPLPDPSIAKWKVDGAPSAGDVYGVEEAQPLPFADAPSSTAGLIVPDNIFVRGPGDGPPPGSATEEGEMLCDQCGYDLFQLQSDRCPECGHPIRWSNVDFQRMQREVHGRVDWSWLRWMLLGVAICTPLLLVVTLIPVFSSNVGGATSSAIVGSRVLIVVGLLTIAWCCRGAANDLPRDSDDVVSTIGVVASGIVFFTMLATSILGAIVKAVV